MLNFQIVLVGLFLEVELYALQFMLIDQFEHRPIFLMNKNMDDLLWFKRFTAIVYGRTSGHDILTVQSSIEIPLELTAKNQNVATLHDKAWFQAGDLWCPIELVV